MFYRTVLIISFTLACFTGSAQFGFRTSYNFNNAPQWDDFYSEAISSDARIFETSLTFTADYWMRLANTRIEFYPNISFHQATTTLTNISVGTPDLPLQLRQIGIGVLTHIYVLDLIGDCDCPTFSKQGGLMKKGFFIMAGIGADYSQKNVANDAHSDGNVDFKASLGLGLDLGITDLITLSPFVQYQYFPSISWHELGSRLNMPERNVESKLNQFQIGIRIGFRPDYR